jgi:hypothetical protein
VVYTYFINLAKPVIYLLIFSNPSLAKSNTPVAGLATTPITPLPTPFRKLVVLFDLAPSIGSRTTPVIPS